MSFYYHPRMLSYDFGPQHPLRPERLRKTIELLGAFGVQPLDPGEGREEDALRVHSADYLDALARADLIEASHARTYGFGTSDTPKFPNMLRASLDYMAGSVRAAEDIRDGANIAFNLSGGLHHAQFANASGFCVINDCAVAIAIFRERFSRVAYVDIDVHHGDGVQALFFDDPNVMTCSIHQDGRTLYPGTGFVGETGADFSSINVPLWPETTGDVWLWAFREVIMKSLVRFRPEAIVLQMGADSHDLDPLAMIRNDVGHWLEAVKDVRDFGVPIVAIGGGGYNVSNVIRMWTAAVLTLMNQEVPQHLPEPFATQWGIANFFDPEYPFSSGRETAEKAVADFRVLEASSPRI